MRLPTLTTDWGAAWGGVMRAQHKITIELSRKHVSQTVLQSRVKTSPCFPVFSTSQLGTHTTAFQLRAGTLTRVTGYGPPDSCFRNGPSHFGRLVLRKWCIWITTSGALAQLRSSDRRGIQDSVFRLVPRIVPQHQSLRPYPPCNERIIDDCGMAVGETVLSPWRL